MLCLLYTSENHPGIKVIILTENSEFSYAREAVSLKVYEYILKPVDTDEIYKVLKKCKDELDRERETQDNIMHLEHTRYRALTLMQENYLNRLVVQEIEPEKLAHEFSGLGIDFPLQSGGYTCMLDVYKRQVKGVVNMGRLAQDNYKLAINSIIESNYNRLDEVNHNENKIDEMEGIFTNFLVKIAEKPVNEKENLVVSNLFHTINDICLLYTSRCV